MGKDWKAPWFYQSSQDQKQRCKVCVCGKVNAQLCVCVCVCVHSTPRATTVHFRRDFKAKVMCVPDNGEHEWPLSPSSKTRNLIHNGHI